MGNNQQQQFNNNNNNNNQQQQFNNNGGMQQRFNQGPNANGNFNMPPINIPQYGPFNFNPYSQGGPPVGQPTPFQNWWSRFNPNGMTPFQANRFANPGQQFNPQSGMWSSQFQMNRPNFGVRS